jgi:hypothetical protein
MIVGVPTKATAAEQKDYDDATEYLCAARDVSGRHIPVRRLQLPLCARRGQGGMKH